jgi:[acyl-carrier-protein] S-malonyltransferase
LSIFQKELTKTSNLQPAILTVCYAIFKLHQEEFEVISSLGHSLGEYTSLVCSESISFSDAIQLVQKRGKFMEECIKESKFEMCALLPCSYENALDLCLETTRETNLVCDIASVNSSSQVVISGDKEVQ